MNENNLKVRILFDGKCVKENDMLLTNFLKYQLVKNMMALGINIKDEGGVARDIAFNTYTNEKKIALGTGTTSPTRDDYGLENKVAEQTTITLYQSADKVIYSATFVFDSDTDITEAAFFVKPNAPLVWFCMTRDVFAAEHFSAGVPRTVSIEISI
jgi:hypothetical protein